MNLWAIIITAATGLLGAGIGSASVLLSERWRARTSADQDRRAADLRLRDERKEVLIRFFSLVRALERVAERRYDGEEVAAEEVADLTSRLWLLHVEVHLLCTQPVADAVYTLSERLTESARQLTEEAVHIHLSEARLAAISTARAELGISGSLSLAQA
ncbi:MULTISPECIES: hypothetical protein [Streptomyces]|jgi:hypothetical protein|uniref:Uncharacterized protein n=1 Tax=Streptomyces ortus TaxID=2867268 RepID=A0ABT3UVZ8_9ACTN|nr:MULTISPECIES: hypothetical protein [Streptomyces]MCX4231740.1 hypothetical protein [Streptomyces ortus]